MTSLLDSHRKAPTPDPVSSTTTAPRQRQDHRYGDKYTIRGRSVQIRTKKFQEDMTPIQCNDVDEILGMYSLLRQVAGQYGIHLTQLADIDVWDNPGNTKPPTFPYQLRDFTSQDDYFQAYSSMSLALATKLKTSVQFSSSFHAVSLTVHDYATDGFKMAYHLLCMAHHKLQRKKFVRLTKPKFTGNMFAYIAKYQNWITYNNTRSIPHVYDDDKIADDVLETIRQSQWADKLKAGLDEVEAKLERWKLEEMAHPAAPFPFELRLEFIGHTILEYYILQNENPLSDTCPRVCAAYQRGRSRSRTPATPNRNGSRTRSNSSTADLTPCNICGGMHRSTSSGCPHVVRQYYLNRYFSDTSNRDIERMVQNIEQSRSQSRKRTRSRSLDRSRSDSQT